MARLLSSARASLSTSVSTRLAHQAALPVSRHTPCGYFGSRALSSGCATCFASLAPQPPMSVAQQQALGLGPRKHGSLEVHMIPSIYDNYIFVLRETGANKVAVVDPSEDEPVSRFVHDRGFGCVVHGASADSHRIPGLDVALGEGSTFTFGDAPVEVLECHGHTVGHILFHFPEHKVAFVGDTIFVVGCGRMFEGNPEMMHASLRKIAALPPETVLYCAHEYTTSNVKFALDWDPENAALKERAEAFAAMRKENIATVPTTVADELATNPFLRCKDAAAFAAVRKAKDNF